MARTSRQQGPVRVPRESRALGLEHGAWRQPSERDIALALKRSPRPRRTREPPHQTTFARLGSAVRQAGKNLSAARRRVVKRARQTLRRVFDRA